MHFLAHPGALRCSGERGDEGRAQAIPARSCQAATPPAACSQGLSQAVHAAFRKGTVTRAQLLSLPSAGARLSPGPRPQGQLCPAVPASRRLKHFTDCPSPAEKPGKAEISPFVTPQFTVFLGFRTYPVSYFKFPHQAPPPPSHRPEKSPACWRRAVLLLSSWKMMCRNLPPTPITC